MWIALTIVLATLAASFTDWLFMDALIHRFYAAHPDTWRPSEGAGRIIVSQVIGTATTAAAVLLCLLIPGRPLLLAIAIWAAGPLPCQPADAAMDAASIPLSWPATPPAGSPAC